MYSGISPPADVNASLMTAVIDSSEAPLVLLDEDLCVIAASRSFTRQFQLEREVVAGSEFAILGQGEWGIAQLGALLRGTISGFAGINGYEVDLKRVGRETRHLLISAEKLVYLDSKHARLLLSVTDVTEVRLAEKIRANLVHDNEVLQKEVQHRIANSLQIIASVLMQSALKVQSDEARGYLKDAHNRVLSIATMQRQLASSGEGTIPLRLYFTDLCRSIAASMIADENHLSIEIAVDDTETDSDTSVSLGLIVTELTINAIKHAFPDNGGTINVDYSSRDLSWKLRVADDGIGMPLEGVTIKAGLGTSIVEALARQLKAEVKVARRNPGTDVSVTHVHDQPKPTISAV